jgi:hypothetical protein
MDEEKKRRTNVRIVSEPTPVRWIVENATSEQLEYLNRLAKASDFKVFVNLVENFTKYNIEEVFGYRAKDAEDLAQFRDAKRGEVAGLVALLRACRAASDEIQRRKGAKK